VNSNGAMYDASFNWDGVSGAIYSGTFTTRATTAYIRLSVSNADLNTAQLELGSTATSYAPYGFLSLNDIFVDGQLLLNPNFDNGTTNWNITSATGSVSDGIYTFTASSIAGRIESIPNFTIINNVYYSVSNYKASSPGVRVALLGGNAPGEHPGNNIFMTISARETASQVNRPASIIDIKTTGFTAIEVDYVKSYNLTNLGIDHLNKQTLDYYYNIWEQNNAYIEGYDDGFEVGYDDGFEVGYDEGFDDGVACDTSYAVGYALGLSEGEDMETGSSLLILIVSLIGFVMMIFGFTTKRGIFNLLSVGAFVVLGTLLVQFVGFVIIAIGLVLINIYYAFFGDL
jgi:hypothetical protein